MEVGKLACKSGTSASAAKFPDTVLRRLLWVADQHSRSYGQTTGSMVSCCRTVRLWQSLTFRRQRSSIYCFSLIQSIGRPA